MLDNVNLLRLENVRGDFGPSGFRLAGTGVNKLLQYPMRDTDGRKARKSC
jgi:hypothetical protein